MSKEENVVRYYVLCNKLKDVIRTGWIDWKVNRQRIESVAEHIFGVQMLAIAMHSEFQYKNIDIKKVIYMLAIHELEEILIGDLTLFQVSKEEKNKLGHEAIENVLSNLLNKEEIKSLILEFDERLTPESRFAFYCDKLECDIQSRIYDEENCVDLTHQEGNNAFNNSEVQSLLKSEGSFSKMWLQFGQNRYRYDKNFTAVSNYVKSNPILSLKQKVQK